eukprot:Nitzschia sp. Nitz4//scaffold121_size67750//58019//59379//NITZ4_006075-RA/size67750-augustus-gene-0.132-mRNA-1//-1//CDS//3329534372//8083//frame0
MEGFMDTIDDAIRSKNYTEIANVFFSLPSSQSIGQGEQRSLAAHLIKAAVRTPGFLPAAFSSGQMMRVLIDVLSHLPTTVDEAADSQLRRLIFDYKVQQEGDYAGAARVLADIRMEDDKTSVYYTAPAEKCDVYVKIAECFLEEDEIVESDNAVTKAGSVVGMIQNPDDHKALILRYKSTCARVLDSNRKFLQAASRYHDLSLSSAELVRADDLLEMLGRATTCAILAPSGPQRQRVLGHIYKDERIGQLESISGLESHASILRKMCMNQILRKDELTKFEASLQPHQKAIMGDGLSIMERGVVEHNMVAVSKVYQTIYISELALILGVSSERAERIAANMIMDGSLPGSLDQVEGLLEFDSEDSSHTAWDKSISHFCLDLNRIANAIQETKAN